MKVSLNVLMFLFLLVLKSLVSSTFVSDQIETCVCKPRKPIIKYIAVEVPKIVHVPPPTPKIPQHTKYLAIQEVLLPNSQSHPHSHSQSLPHSHFPTSTHSYVPDALVQKWGD